MVHLEIFGLACVFGCATRVFFGRRYAVLLFSRPQCLNRPSSRDQLNHEHYKSDDKEDMNESSQGVRRHHPQQPQNKKDDKDRPKHHSPPASFFTAHKEALTPRGRSRLFVADVQKEPA
jgi:hypothetical protein